jgi:NAD(P)-dependent dehydrogenase (short-subunit alcohol dehydrogenase family)
VRALVTGASRGIGRAVSRRLHAEGARLVLSARREAHLAAISAELPGSIALAADLAEPARPSELVDRAVAALGGLDALIHCAGVVHYADALAVTPAELEAQLQLNTIAPFWLTQRAGQHMSAAGGGAIVHVASSLGVRPARGTAAYATSKAGLLGLTRAFALELAPHKVRVNAIAPGVVDTDMVRVVRTSDRADLGAEQTRERIERQLEALSRLHPLGRLGSPEDVADAVVFLLRSEFTTGTTLFVDGGLTL